MYKRLPYFRSLVIKYNRYRRKIRRYESLNRQGRPKKSWIEKRINQLKLKIEQYLESASLAKKAALLSAGLLSFGVATGQSYELRSDHPFYNIVGNDEIRFEDTESAISWLENNKFNSAVILVKASRGIGLEKLVQVL